MPHHLFVLARTMRPLAAATLACFVLTAQAQNIVRVGANRAIQSIASAAAQAQDGDTVEVDAGDYRGDVAVWNQANITVRAVGGRVKLMAEGNAAEGKAIWVVRTGRMTVDGFDFSGAKVPDKNGAGIRLEKGLLTVRDCSFTGNENGILTGNDPQVELEIANSEFGHNGHGDGQSHNLYVGGIARLKVTGSYFHHAKVGHLLKTRAAVNHILYNRITDEPGGSASYELEFANGGIAYVVGNIIQQGSETQNPHLISYAAEGYKWPRNELYLVNNTLVDNRPQGGVFLRVKPGDVIVKAVNNLLVGKGSLESAGSGDYRNNLNVDSDQFVSAARGDFRLKAGGSFLGRAADAESADGSSLMPNSEYAHPRQVAAIKGRSKHPGALQSVK